MNDRRSLVSYLDNYWGQQLWSASYDLMRDQILAEGGWSLAQDVGPFEGFTNIRTSFTSPPAIWQHRGTVRIRFPRPPTPSETGYHHLEADIMLTDPILDAKITLAFAINLDVHADSDPQIDLDFAKRDLQWLPLDLLPAFGVLQKDHILSGVTHRANERLTRYFGRIRFDDGNEAELAHPSTRSLIEPAVSVASKKYDHPRSDGYIDLLFVADGYSARHDERDIDYFLKHTQDLADYLEGPDSTEPYRSFHTALRVWRMPLISDNLGSTAARVAMTVGQAGKPELGFGNLARFAEVGLTARAYFGRDPLLIIVSRTVGEREEYTRSFSSGPFVLLNHNTERDNSLDSTAYYRASLQHELGHSLLGRGLADEYEESEEGTAPGGGPAGEPRHYYGPEPLKRNVSTNPQLLRAAQEWGYWASRTELGVAATGYPGGYYFSSGIYRPEATCQMRESNQISEFCEVCREQLLLGMTDFATQQYKRGILDIEAIYRVFTDPIYLHLNERGSGSLPVCPGGAPGLVDTATYVTLRISCASVPEPWQVKWRVWEPSDIPWQGYVEHPIMESSGEIRLVARLGYRVDVEVSTATPFLSPRSPRHVLRATLDFDQERTPGPPDLLPPENLTQWVDWGSQVNLVIDSRDGSISWPSPAWLEADAGDIVGFRLPVRTLFTVSHEGRASHWIRVGPTAPRARVRADLVVLPEGKYTWSVANAGDNVLGMPTNAPPNGDVAFEVAPLDLTSAGAGPAIPLLPKVHHWISGQVIALSAYSWHPADRKIRFEFEVRDQGEQFSEVPTHQTDLLDRPRADFHSDLDPKRPTAGMRGSVGDLGDIGFGQTKKFRVRAVDEDERPSAWVDGPDIRREAPRREPLSPEELEALRDPRLEAIARRLHEYGLLEELILFPEGPRPPDRIPELRDLGFDDGLLRPWER